MDAFAWAVVGSVAGVVGAAAAIAFGLIPLLRDRRKKRSAQGDGGSGAEKPGVNPPGLMETPNPRKGGVMPAPRKYPKAA